VLAQADWRALGTGVRLLVLDGDLAAARRAVEDVVDRVDRTYSRFRPDSELMALHGRRGSTVAASPLLVRVIGGALDAARRSGGAVDPTVGRAMRVVGYDADFDALTSRTGPIELRTAPVPGWTTVRLDRAAGTVRLPTDVELDLGSTGKGLAADLAAEAALAVAGPGAGVLVSLGGDLAAVGRAPEGGWRVLVTDDSRTASDAPGDVIAIARGAVATSSTTVRRWRVADGVTAHHIVDPRTGLPAETRWRTATVVAETCEAANAASTAAIVLGDAAPAWLEAAGLPARLVTADGHVVRLAGWPEPIPVADPGPDAGMVDGRGRTLAGTAARP
jgi:FAD:protein FMN transferase